MELPFEIQRTLTDLNAAQATTWTIQVRKGKIHLSVDFERTQPQSPSRCSTFRGGIPSRTGHPSDDLESLLDEDEDLDDGRKKKPKKKRKKGPSARRRDARRLTEFLEKKRKEKEEKEREKSLDCSTPQIPGISKSNPDISLQGVMPEDSGVPEVMSTSSPTRSSLEDRLEECDMSFVDEEESGGAPSISSDPSSPHLLDQSAGKESSTTEPEEEPWEDDLQKFLETQKETLEWAGGHAKANCETILKACRREWLQTNKDRYTNVAARTQPYAAKQQPQSSQATPPKPKPKSATKPPPRKKKKTKRGH